MIVDSDVFNGVGNSQKLFALGPNGQYLTMIRTQYLRGPDQPSLEVYYFYGDVQGIELFQRGASEIVPYSFDASLSPASATVLGLIPSSRLNAEVVACASRDIAAQYPVSQWIAVLLL